MVFNEYTEHAAVKLTRRFKVNRLFVGGALPGITRVLCRCPFYSVSDDRQIAPITVVTRSAVAWTRLTGPSGFRYSSRVSRFQPDFMSLTQFILSEYFHRYWYDTRLRVLSKFWQGLAEPRRRLCYTPYGNSCFPYGNRRYRVPRPTLFSTNFRLARNYGPNRGARSRFCAFKPRRNKNTCRHTCYARKRGAGDNRPGFPYAFWRRNKKKNAHAVTSCGTFRRAESRQ